MKRLISLSSLLVATVCTVLFFLSPKKKIQAEALNQHPYVTQAMHQLSPRMMPAEMFKDYVIDRLTNQDPHVFDLLTPLMLMATKQHEVARSLLRHETEATDEQLLALRNNPATAELAMMIDIAAQGCNVATACKKLLPVVTTLDVTPLNKHQYKRGGYATYYADKKEDYSLEEQASWGEKQKNVYKVLCETKPQTVLDLGANSGWFTRLAAHCGATVKATEIDETCINFQYEAAKAQNLPIIPMLLSFEKTEPHLYQADVVLCLALVHHLVFLCGLKLEEIFERLAKLTKKVLVLEYVDIEDDSKNVLVNPGFWQNKKQYEVVLNRFQTYKQMYTLENFTRIGKHFFNKVTYVKSTPESTRSLLIFER